MIKSLETFPNLSLLVGEVARVWPEHAGFLKLRFSDPSTAQLELSETLAALILKLAGGELELYCRDYRWTCKILVEEDLFFRRKGCYRRSSFHDVEREVYGNPDFMAPYLRGLLLSQVLWANQTEALQFYVGTFLPLIPSGARLLEVGPGHGLLLYFASECANIDSVTGWDISDSSLTMTAAALEKLGLETPPLLLKVDIGVEREKESGFDAVVMSELLEHLEHPEMAVRSVAAHVRPGGLLYVNVPINSPAPDHIFNWSTVEDVAAMLSDNGFSVLDSLCAPMTGCTLAQAVVLKRTINIAVVGKRMSAA